VSCKSFGSHCIEPALIEVSDLYTALVDLARQAWERFEFEPDPHGWSAEWQRMGDHEGMWFDDLADLFEYRLFLAACSRRWLREKGEAISTNEIPSRLIVTDTTGQRLDGFAGQYHSHSFDWIDEIEPMVVCGDFQLRRLGKEVRLFLLDSRPHDPTT
jgi:hypothetical protein